MLLLASEPLRLVVRRAHQELTGRYVAKDLLHAQQVFAHHQSVLVDFGGCGAGPEGFNTSHCRLIRHETTLIRHGGAKTKRVFYACGLNDQTS